MRKGLSLFLFLIFPLMLSAEVLTPYSDSVVTRGRIHLVFTGPENARVLVKRGKNVLFVLKKEKDGIFYHHYILELKKGKNLFYIDPGGIKLQISFRSTPFPFKFHNKKSERKCFSCHFKRAKAVECFSCHRFRKGKRIYMHGPFARKECFYCHNRNYVRGIRFGVKGKTDFDLCSQCHFAPLVWQDMLYQHGPFGARNCTACHDPHQGRYKFLLKNEPKIGVCLACHKKKEQEFSTSGYRFHPILSAKGCTVCHDPHATDFPKQLFAKPFRVCVACHPGFKSVKRGHPVVAHPVVGPFIPGTNRKLTCSSCHDPHGSLYDNLLYAPKAGNKICLLCHKY